MLIIYHIRFTECDDGTYGYSCVNYCSGHCLNDSPCNKQTGLCDRGCNPGYTNGNCSKSKFTNEDINMYVTGDVTRDIQIGTVIKVIVQINIYTLCFKIEKKYVFRLIM